MLFVLRDLYFGILDEIYTRILYVCVYMLYVCVYLYIYDMKFLLRVDRTAEFCFIDRVQEFYYSTSKILLKTVT